MRDIGRSARSIPATKQLDLYQAVSRLIIATSAWYLRNDHSNASLNVRIAELRQVRAALEPNFAGMVPAFTRDRMRIRKAGFAAAGAPEKLAEQLSLLEVGEQVPDIAVVAKTAKVDIIAAAKAFFGVSEALRIRRIEDAANAITTSDYYEGLALSRASDTVGTARRGIAVAALTAHASATDPVSAWLEAGAEAIGRTRERLQALTEGVT